MKWAAIVDLHVAQNIDILASSRVHGIFSRIPLPFSGCRRRSRPRRYPASSHTDSDATPTSSGHPARVASPAPASSSTSFACAYFGARSSGAANLFFNRVTPAYRHSFRHLPTSCPVSSISWLLASAPREKTNVRLRLRAPLYPPPPAPGRVWTGL